MKLPSKSPIKSYPTKLDKTNKIHKSKNQINVETRNILHKNLDAVLPWCVFYGTSLNSALPGCWYHWNMSNKNIWLPSLGKRWWDRCVCACDVKWVQQYITSIRFTLNVYLPALPNPITLWGFREQQPTVQHTQVTYTFFHISKILMTEKRCNMVNKTGRKMQHKRDNLLLSLKAEINATTILWWGTGMICVA